MKYIWPTEELAKGAVPSANIGRRRLAWLHPKRPAYVKLNLHRHGEPLDSLTVYCRDEVEARRQGEAFVNRWL